MAYVSQELKSTLAPAIKKICKKYGVKASLAVRNHSTLVLNIKSGKIDFLENTDPKCDYLQVNTYWISDHFSGVARDFLTEVKDAMNVGNWDKSEVQIDYFNVGWYVDINVGKWNKPYVLEA